MKLLTMVLVLMLAGCATYREPIAIAGKTAPDFWRGLEAAAGGDGQ